MTLSKQIFANASLTSSAILSVESFPPPPVPRRYISILACLPSVRIPSHRMRKSVVLVISRKVLSTQRRSIEKYDYCRNDSLISSSSWRNSPIFTAHIWWREPSMSFVAAAIFAWVFRGSTWKSASLCIYPMATALRSRSQSNRLPTRSFTDGCTLFIAASIPSQWGSLPSIFFLYKSHRLHTFLSSSSLGLCTG